jgi:hypothetical protein
VTIEEFDTLILQIHNGEIEQYKDLAIECWKKTGWNSMLDDISRNLYPIMVMFLTTNKPPSFFNDLDQSYIRKGRVDLIIEVTYSYVFSILLNINLQFFVNKSKLSEQSNMHIYTHANINQTYITLLPPSFL